MPKIPAAVSDSKALGSSYQDGSYLESNPTYHVEHSPWKASHIVKILQQRNISPTSICEVGCGAGQILRELSNQYPNVKMTGYEPSPAGFKLCLDQPRPNIDFKCELIADSTGFYDCLLCIDVFEHVEDYMGFLRSLRSKANYKVFHIPLDMFALGVFRNVQMRNRNEVGHLHYFSRETALATLRDCGYEILDSFYTKTFLDFPSPSFKAMLAKPFRALAFAVAPHLMVRVAGGCSLMVLAK